MLHSTEERDLFQTPRLGRVRATLDAFDSTIKFLEPHFIKTRVAVIFHLLFVVE